MYIGVVPLVPYMVPAGKNKIKCIRCLPAFYIAGLTPTLCLVTKGIAGLTPILCLVTKGIAGLTPTLCLVTKGIAGLAPILCLVTKGIAGLAPILCLVWLFQFLVFLHAILHVNGAWLYYQRCGSFLFISEFSAEPYLFTRLLPYIFVREKLFRFQKSSFFFPVKFTGQPNKYELLYYKAKAHYGVWLGFLYSLLSIICPFNIYIYEVYSTKLKHTTASGFEINLY